MNLHRLAVSTALLLIACAASPTASPSPSLTSTPSTAPTPTATTSVAPSASPSASPSTIPSASATASPTATLTLPPPPTPTTPPTPTPAPTADPNGWTELTGFPTYGPRTQLTGVAYGEGRFVAVGWSLRNGNTRGRVWTSADGLSWQAQPTAAFAGLTLEAVTHNGTDFYAFASAPTSLWRSADGTSWEQVDLPLIAEGELGSWTAFNGSYVVSDASSVGTTMYAAGGANVIGGDIACNCVNVWRSVNGIDWETSTVSEDDSFMAFAATPEVVLVITYGNYIGQGLRYSTNSSGQDWNTPDIDLEGTGYLDAASDGQRIVAVGYSGEEFDEAIAVVTDGTTWTTSLIDGGGNGPAEQLAYAGGRFVAVGAQRRTPGSSWWSADGQAWTSGPDVPFPPADPLPPEAGDDPFTHRTIGGGAPGVVLAQTYDGGLHVWFAPVTAFD